jgi:hypothetical protein
MMAPPRKAGSGRDAVTMSNVVAWIWPKLIWLDSCFRAKGEKPMVAFREWLKIVISGAAIVALFLTTRQLSIQTSALMTQGVQLKTQTEQLKVQADQLKIQTQQAGQATRAANIALASRLSSQLIDIENTQIKLGLLSDHWTR